MNLAQNVKKLRTNKGLSQEVLADEAGVSLRTIQRIENNETVPRGDTLQKIAIALNTSPDEIVEWKVQEDNNYLMLMCLSGLSFLFFPLLGIIVPLTLWILKKDKLKNANSVGKSILNFQITWSFLLFLNYIYFFVSFQGITFGGLLPELEFNLVNTFLPVAILYVLNIAMTLYNAYRIHKNKHTLYKPAIRLLR